MPQSGDDQVDTVGMELVDGNGVQAIALFQTSGDIGDTVGTVAAQEICQQAGGGDAVHIVVAEDGDLFLPGKSQAYTAGGQIHIGHEERIQQRGIAVQISLRVTNRSDAPGGQDHGGQRGVAAGNQGIDGPRLRLCNIPNSVFQSDTHPL